MALTATEWELAQQFLERVALKATESRHFYVTSISLIVFGFRRVLFRKGHGNLGPCH